MGHSQTKLGQLSKEIPDSSGSLSTDSTVPSKQPHDTQKGESRGKSQEKRKGPRSPLAILKQLIYSISAFVLLAIVLLFWIWLQITRPVPCTPNCIGVNLLGRDLNGMDLANIELVEANLQGADLSGANLRQADLSGANLTRAILRNADLTEARLIGASLDGADLGGSILTGVNLNGAILDQADLTSVDLTEVSLSGSSFIGAQLTGVTLTKASLGGIQFTQAILAGATLDDAMLTGASFSAADLSGASLQRVNLTGAWLNLAKLTGADLSDSNLAGSRLIGTDLTSANLQRSDLHSTVLIGADFSGANVRGANFAQSNGLAVNVNEADFQLDPVLAELNNLQLAQVKIDAILKGVDEDASTIWEPSLRQMSIAAGTGEGFQAQGSGSSRQEVATAQIVTGTFTPTLTTVLLTTNQLTQTIADPKKMLVNFFINQLTNSPSQPEAFEIDFYIDVFWQDDSLIHDDIKGLDSDTLFDPKLTIVNGTQSKLIEKTYRNSLEPNTNIQLHQHMVTTIVPKFDFRRFPFDAQLVPIVLESATFESDKVHFEFKGLIEPAPLSDVPQRQSIPRGRYVDLHRIDSEWRLANTQVEQQIYIYPHTESTWSQVTILLDLQRVATRYLWQTWLVMSIIFLSIGVVLIFDHHSFAQRLWSLFILLWIVVAFQAVLTTIQSNMNVFTFLDFYLLLCYGAIFIMCIIILIIQILLRIQQERLAKWVNTIAVFAYPILFIAINVGLLINVLSQ
ncbi:MAG: pentapeptide repeat-containing protein [Chloroflexota bacterium]